jgi:hypothetical protein
MFHTVAIDMLQVRCCKSKVLGAPMMLTYAEMLCSSSPPRTSAVSAAWLAPSTNTHAEIADACTSAEPASRKSQASLHADLTVAQ